MRLVRKPYTGRADLQRMQTMLAESIHAAGDRGYMHVGDIPHRIYNGLRHHPDRHQLVHLWQTRADQLVGWSLIYPQWNAFDTQVHADYKGTAAERAILAWTIDEVVRHLRANPAGDNGEGDQYIHTDVHVGDTTRIKLLTGLGFTDQKHTMNLTTRALDAIPEPVVPDGFTIRPSAGLPDAERLIAVHSGAFDSAWTLEQYQMVLASPGFVVENELVVVTPTGEFAAFTIIWFDVVNRVGLFEPVGTHKAFQRRGLGRALLYHAMHVMKANHMTTALVGHRADDAAAAYFYQALGFRPKYEVHDYGWHVPRGR
jgi:mycothiol synthase